MPPVPIFKTVTSTQVVSGIVDPEDPEETFRVTEARARAPVAQGHNARDRAQGKCILNFCSLRFCILCFCNFHGRPRGYVFACF